MQKYWSVMFIKVSGCILIAAFCCSTLQAQSAKDTTDKIEKIFARYKPQNPGAQLTISKNGVILFSKAWGMANLENNIPMSLNNVTEAGSVSKQFTAAAVLMLEMQGKLSIDDDIRKYIPEMPDYGVEIKIRHLMHHSSGLRDWGSIAELAGWPRTTKTYHNEDALEIIVRQKTLNNIPGDEFGYSNSNFNLQGLIVERVSGITLAEFCNKNIFVPAGMTHTEWRDNFKKIVANRAIAYEKKNGTYFTDMPNEYVYGHGGLITTTEDLCKWVDFYASAKLGGPLLLKKQLEMDNFNDGSRNVYAAGLRILKAKGYDVYRHNGATASYRASLEYFPEVGLTIAGLSNTSEFDSSYDAFSQLEDIFLTAKTSVVKPAELKLDSAKLLIFAGAYRAIKSGEGLKVTYEKGRLYGNNFPLVAISQNIFRFGADVLMFDKPGRIRFVISDRDTIIYLPVENANITPALLQQYAATYHSNETASDLKIVLEDNKLRLYMHPYKFYELTPVYKDAFIIEGLGGTVYFEGKKSGHFTTMKASISRARNVLFTKIK
jgi:CubicO group peptidase (beta-lactamase class C family)